MDKLHYVLIAALVVVSFLWFSGGSDVAAPSTPSDDGTLRAWMDCAVQFHEDLQTLDPLKKGDVDYRALYTARGELINKRVACENAIPR